MRLTELVVRLHKLHRGYKAGALSPEERATYASMRDEFVATVVRAQRLVLRPGQAQRQVMRVTTALKLQVTLAGRPHTTITLDIGSGGFAALIGEQVEIGTVGDFALRAGAETLRGRARVVASVRYGSSCATFRTSFAIDSMGDGDRVKLEDRVLEAAMAVVAADPAVAPYLNHSLGGGM